MHQGLQISCDVSVVDEAVFFYFEIRITPFKVSSVIIPDAMSENKVLRSGGCSNGVSLDKRQLFQRPI